jgi:hypothetical protein
VSRVDLPRISRHREAEVPGDASLTRVESARQLPPALLGVGGIEREGHESWEAMRAQRTEGMRKERKM